MNRGKMFRSRFGQRLHQWQDKANQIESTVRDQATSLAEQTRDGLTRGQKTVSGWEKAVKSSVRANPLLFLGAMLAAMALAGLAGGLLMKRHR